jgi:hypothetical protein
MTEAGWAMSEDPHQMLRPCRKIIRYHARKGRLFAVACCERIRHLLTDPRSLAAVEVVARYTDGLATDDQLREARADAAHAHAEAFEAKGKEGACAEWAAQFTADHDAWLAVMYASNFAYVAAGDGLEPGPEHIAQAHLLRCIFGPLPFRSVAVDPVWLAWNDGTVLELARGIYDERAFDRLPILVDALEDAGCTQPDILTHCRQPGDHVRGCWLVDLLLGKQ